MKVTMLGTGHAMVTACYNTCFALQNDDQAPKAPSSARFAETHETPGAFAGAVSTGGDETSARFAETHETPKASKAPRLSSEPFEPAVFLVDGGGGSQILRQLKRAGIRIEQIHDLFVTHKHIDHMLGIIWVLRAIIGSSKRGRYQGEARLYAHQDLARLIRSICRETLDMPKGSDLDELVRFIEVGNGSEHTVIGHPVTFFDLGKECKVRQFGMSLALEGGRRIVCLGDEPCHPEGERFAKDGYLVFHEAFCLDSDEGRYHPRAIGHSTVRTACELAQRLNVQNLVLYHTEDERLKDRKRLYAAEGSRYFAGGLYIPDDLEELRF